MGLGCISDVGLIGWLLALLVVLVTLWFLLRSRPANAPPGPTALPLIGDLLSLPDRDMRKAFYKLATKYGDLMKFDMGFRRMIVLNTYEAMKDSLLRQRDVYVFRPQGMFARTRFDLGIGGLNTHWSEQRRFLTHTFRTLGVGADRMESIIQEEFTSLIKHMSAITNTPMIIDEMFNKISSQVVLRLLFGKLVAHDDTLHLKHLRLNKELTTLLEKRILSTCFPFLKYFPGNWTYNKQMKSLALQLEDIVMQWIAEKRRTIDYNSEPCDFIEAYLQEMKSNVDSQNQGYTDRMLVYHVIDIHSASVDTTAAATTFAVYQMILQPVVQKKVQNEIDDIVGSRQPCLRDRTKMPYTEAVLNEVLRLCPPLPLSVPHTNNEETEIKGYRIPQWSYILMNIYFAHRDPKVWSDPEKFYPDRFLDSSGQFFKREELIPFGIGKRNCLGESLARSELFLIFVGVMQHFSFRIPHGGTKPEPEGMAGFVVHPKPVEILVESRCSN